jgi:hypothetical protein
MMIRGHKIAALMDDDKALLPQSLAEYDLLDELEFYWECKDATNHSRKGSQIYCYIRSSFDDEALIEKNADYLRSHFMPVDIV